MSMDTNDLPNFCDHYNAEQLKSIFCALQNGTFLPDYETSVILQKMILDVWSHRTGSEWLAGGPRDVVEHKSVLVNSRGERQRKN
jgi:hypothetical protein